MMLLRHSNCTYGMLNRHIFFIYTILFIFIGHCRSALGAHCWLWSPWQLCKRSNIINTLYNHPWRAVKALQRQWHLTECWTISLQEPMTTTAIVLRPLCTPYGVARVLTVLLWWPCVHTTALISTVLSACTKTVLMSACTKWASWLSIRCDSNVSICYATEMLLHAPLRFAFFLDALRTLP